MSLNIGVIQRGVVIDHIKAGRGMEIVDLLNLNEMTCPVAVIRNARSSKSGKKDIIKIEDNIDLNLDVLGFIDPHITVNIINDGEVVEKRRIDPPNIIRNVVKCKNPRCISSEERQIEQIFYRETSCEDSYRCHYCDQKYEPPFR